MGALFAVPTVISSNLAETLRDLTQKGYRTYAATLNDTALSLDRLAVDSHSCFVIGNEGHGLSEDIIALCEGSVYIPMTGDCESLNASIAASVLMWEIYKSTRH